MEIGRGVSVEDTESNTLLICGDHGYCIDVCWLQFCLLDPNGIGWSDAVMSVGYLALASPAYYRSGLLGRLSRCPSRMKLENSLRLGVNITRMFGIATHGWKIVCLRIPFGLVVNGEI